MVTKLTSAKPATGKATVTPAPIDEIVAPSFSSRGIPPIAMFEVAQILFAYGLNSPEFKEAAARRAREQGEKRLWK